MEHKILWAWHNYDISHVCPLFFLRCHDNWKLCQNYWCSTYFAIIFLMYRVGICWWAFKNPSNDTIFPCFDTGILPLMIFLIFIRIRSNPTKSEEFQHYTRLLIPMKRIFFSPIRLLSSSLGMIPSSLGKSMACFGHFFEISPSRGIFPVSFEGFPCIISGILSVSRTHGQWFLLHR